MVATALIHRADHKTGLTSKTTYEKLMDVTGRPRGMVGRGLLAARDLGIIAPHDRSTYRIVHEGLRADGTINRRWAKLPSRAMFTPAHIGLFEDMHLRRPSELHAIKLLLFLAAARDGRDNRVKRTHAQISEQAGIPKNGIKRALSHLINADLVQVEKVRVPDQNRMFQFYRLSGIDGNRHSGNSLLDVMETADLGPAACA